MKAGIQGSRGSSKRWSSLLLRPRQLPPGLACALVLPLETDRNKPIRDSFLCLIPMRIKLLTLGNDKTVFFFKGREKNNHKFTYHIPEQSTHLVEFVLSTTSTGGEKSPHVSLKIIYKVKVFTYNHYPYLSKFYAQSKNKWFSLPLGADLSHLPSISKLLSV